MNAFCKLVCAAIVVLAATALAQAGDISSADAKALHDYTLSMDKVKAMQAVQDDIAKDPVLKKQEQSSDNGSRSIAQMQAKVAGNPRFIAVLSRHGLSASDAVLLPLTLMSVGIAAEYPSAATKLSDRVSPAQIAFFKAHQKELTQTKWLYGDSGQ